MPLGVLDKTCAMAQETCALTRLAVQASELLIVVEQK